jgi:DNA-binding transcriptional LysR family regulator
MGFDGRLAGGMGVLAAVVDTGSFIRAAEVLDMSQSGVSRAIARLETRLGVRLFDRSTRSVKLTDEGRRFYEQIAPLLAGMEEAASMASGAVLQVRGRMRINVDPFFSRLMLAPRLGGFLAAHPELELDIVTRDQLGDMVADGYDLGLRFGHPPSSSLVARHLFSARMVTVASPAYIQRHGRPRAPEELRDARWNCLQFRDPQTGKPFPWEFVRGAETVALETRGNLTMNDAGTLHATCLAGIGIAQMMDLGLDQWFADGSLVNLFPDWPDEQFPLYALYPSRHLPPAKVRALLDFLRNINVY